MGNSTSYFDQFGATGLGPTSNPAQLVPSGSGFLETLLKIRRPIVTLRWTPTTWPISVGQLPSVLRLGSRCSDKLTRVCRRPSPEYIRTVQLGNTGSYVSFDKTGNPWHDRAQVLSIDQVGTGVGPFDEAAANASWLNPYNKLAPGFVASLFPPHDPGFRLTLNNPDGSGTSTQLVMSGGPTSGRLAGQASRWRRSISYGAQLVRRCRSLPSRFPQFSRLPQATCLTFLFGRMRYWEWILAACQAATRAPRTFPNPALRSSNTHPPPRQRHGPRTRFL